MTAFLRNKFSGASILKTNIEECFHHYMIAKKLIPIKTLIFTYFIVGNILTYKNIPTRIFFHEFNLLKK